MQKPKRFLRLLGVAGLLVTLFAATIVPAAAQPTPDPDPGQGASEITPPASPGLGQNAIYYPWVANDDEFGLGPADTSITVQNLEALDTYIYIYKGTGDGWELYTTAYLAAWASKTFSADALGIESGTGVPVAVSSWRGDTCITDIGGPGDWALYAGRDINGNDTCSDYEVIVTLFDESPELEEIDVCVAKTAGGLAAPYWDESILGYAEWDDVEDLEFYYGLGGEFGGLNNDGDCSDAESGTVLVPGTIGGVAKTAVDGETLPYTTVSDTSVSGYNAINGWEIDQFDQWYLPIVQTNCGPGGCWDTVIRAANYSGTNAAITLRFFPSDDGSGSLQTGFQINRLINGGATDYVVLSDLVPEGWVGSVHAYSDADIMLMADRFKVGYNMWLTNTGSSADFELFAQVPGGLGNYVLFAPDVRVDYFGWNTGINIANLWEGDNNVSVQYFNMFGNATGTRTQRLAAHGMTYFYDPSQLPQDNSSQDPTQDLNADVVGSALIWSDYPVAVAVDATKYPESTTELDANVFQGTTYSATANVYNWQSVALVQKGNPATGMGATSGINMMNPNSVAAQALVYWINQSGFGADNFGTTGLAIPAYANGFVYTLAQHNLPNGFYGAAVVTATYPIVATSANVDYQVQYDGSVIWNAFNPCGFYRSAGDFDCYLGDPFAQPEGGSVKKIFIDEFDNRIEGAYAALWNEAAYQIYYLGNEDYLGIPQILEGYSDHNGEVTWTNVPEGDWYLFTDHQTVWLWNNQELPMFFQGEFYPDYEWEFTLFTGEDLVFENNLEYIRATKAVYTGIPGIEVCIFGEADEVVDESDTWDPLEDLIFECVEADGDGDAFFFDLPQGWYWIIVNAGIEFEFDPAFEIFVEGPEYFEWGGVYENFPIVDPLGVGALYKEFDVGTYLAGPQSPGIPWDSVAIGAEIFCITPVPSVDGTCEDGDLFAELGPDEFFPVVEDTYAFTLNSVPVGVYELCYFVELTITDGIVIGAVNEVQEADVAGIVAGPGAVTEMDFGGTLTGPVDWVAGDDAANAAAIQAALDAALGAGNTVVTVTGTVISVEFIGVNAGLDVPYLFNVDYSDGNGGLSAVAVEVVVASPEGVEDLNIFWFGCEEFEIVEGVTTELFNDIDEDGIVVGDVIVEVTGTTVGATYEVCLLYGLLFELVLDCEEGVPGNGASVFVTMEPVALALFNAFLEDELGFQVPSVFRARVRDELTDDITLSLDTEVDVLNDPPPHIVVAAPLP